MIFLRVAVPIVLFGAVVYLLQRVWASYVDACE
jgi:hypothetical protein